MIQGFSKLNRNEKIKVLAQNLSLKNDQIKLLDDFFSFGDEVNQRFEGFSENVVSTYPFPYSIAPNFLIDGNWYQVPMVTEESSVVAAASYAARFWAQNGGFHCHVKGSVKVGQIFFRLSENQLLLLSHQNEIKLLLRNAIKPLTQSMEARGGGVKNVILKDLSEKLDNLFVFEMSFETADSMGANFINTCLEAMAAELEQYIADSPVFDLKNYQHIMSILSNYTPECVVECWVEAPIEALYAVDPHKDGAGFAHKFVTAVQIAQINSARATTHNKGIFNGVSAVLLATANDFRAVEAGAHAYAARNKYYQSLSRAEVKDGNFKLVLEIPLAIGTVGGLTELHPMANLSFHILKNPNAQELMKIVASVGLASNFAAVRSLITTGIQAGHMKMHLNNILQFENVTKTEKEQAINHFTQHAVSYSSVRNFLKEIRKT